MKEKYLRKKDGKPSAFEERQTEFFLRPFFSLRFLFLSYASQTVDVKSPCNCAKYSHSFFYYLATKKFIFAHFSQFIILHEFSHSLKEGKGCEQVYCTCKADGGSKMLRSRTYDTGLERLKEERVFCCLKRVWGEAGDGIQCHDLSTMKKSENSNPSEHMVSPRNNKKESRLGSDQIFKKSVVLSHHIPPPPNRWGAAKWSVPEFPVRFIDFIQNSLFLGNA